MTLIARVGDTNLLHRGGAEGLAFAQAQASVFLKAGGVAAAAWRERAVAIHRAFVERRLSPGGCADLLAMALFVEILGLMTLALLCSGQGLQHRGMFDLLANDTRAAPVLATASTLLGQEVRAFLVESRDDDLQANRTGQILCAARALAAAAALAPALPLLIAGYSVGEMAAWGVAGFWSTEQTLRLTARRAELMDQAGGDDDRLGFVRGLKHDAVADLAARFDCAIAIVNPDRLFIIGGMRAGIERCCAAALAQGAVGARLIAVRVASTRLVSRRP